MGRITPTSLYGKQTADSISIASRQRSKTEIADDIGFEQENTLKYSEYYRKEGGGKASKTLLEIGAAPESSWSVTALAPREVFAIQSDFKSKCLEKGGNTHGKSNQDRFQLSSIK